MEGIFSLEKQKNVKQTVAGFRPLRICLHAHERFAGTQRPSGKSLVSEHRTRLGFSVHRAKQLPKRLAHPSPCGAARGSRPAQPRQHREPWGWGPDADSPVRLQVRESTFYIRMSINRGTFTVTLRNLHQQDLSPDWVLLILILNTVTIHSSS